MNLGQFEVLIAIADTGSFTDAAEVVGLTQSAVSYSLSRLEAELGVTLVERGRQGAAVTRVGEDVLQHARSIMTQVDVIRQKTARERGLSLGKVRFGCVPTVPARLLTGIMRDFQHRYPDIEVVLFEGMPNELVDWLAAGVIDVGTVLAKEDYALSVPLVYDEIKVIVSTDHPMAAKGEIVAEELVHEPIIGPKPEYGVLSDLLSLHRLPIPRSRHEVSTQSTIFAMVGENMGVALVPAMFLESSPDGIVALSLVPKLFFRVYLAAAVRSPSTEAFVRSATTWTKEHGYLLTNA